MTCPLASQTGSSLRMKGLDKAAIPCVGCHDSWCERKAKRLRLSIRVTPLKGLK